MKRDALKDHDLIELLVIDHEKLRSVYKEIKKECERHERDNDFCLETLESLRILILAHARGKEMALYNICESLAPEGTLATRRELQDQALHGYVEHSLIEKLLETLMKFEEADDEWKAHFMVMMELLDRHLTEEESQFFQKVRAKFHEDILIDLGQVYLQERDSVLRREISSNPRPSSRLRAKEMMGVEAMN